MMARTARLAGAFVVAAASFAFPSASANVKAPPPAVRSDAEQASALAILKSAHMGGPWAQASSPEEQSRRLLLAAARVRTVEIDSGALVVDAHIAGDAQASCRHYAELAADGRRAPVRIVLADLQNPSGTVAFCGAAARPTAQFAPQVAMGRLKADFAAQGLTFGGLALGSGEAWVSYENHTYPGDAEAAGRIVRVLMRDLPPEIEIFHIVASPAGVPLSEIRIARSAAERASQDTALVPMTPVSISAAPLRVPGAAFAGPRLFWWLRPDLKHFMPGYGAPLQAAIRVNPGVAIEPFKGLTLSSELSATLWHSALRRSDPPTELPRVRTDLGQYLRHGQYGIARLDATYRFRLAPDLVAEARGGLLEDMYMGVGGTVVWRPEGTRLSFAADVYQVWKRDYGRLFGARGFHTVTGHLSATYRAGDTTYSIRAGRYLAGDWGGTFEVAHRLWRGLEIGGWATLTDVPFHRFGTGSFDKGLFLRLSLPELLGRRSDIDLKFRGVLRDGGQRLENDDALARDRAAPDAIARDRNDILMPP